MNKLCSALAMLAMALSASAATAPPKVVFFGDSFTADWPLPSGYINKGVAGDEFFNGFTSDNAVAAFQAAVVSQHPAIVHIMVGQYNFDDDAAYQDALSGYIRDINSMVTEAKAANIKVILGTLVPNDGGQTPPVELFNAALTAYAAQNGVPVVNYHDALCKCVGSATGSLADSIAVDSYGGVEVNGTSTYPPYLAPNPSGQQFALDLMITSAGYTVMTQMAQTAIANVTATLKSGYLQDVELGTADVSGGMVNVNTVGLGEKIQFTPYGIYSDGSTHPQLNSNFAGATGVWTSSNPAVMYVSQSGLAWSVGAGTATIRYTSPNGVKFSSWVMHSF